MPAALQVTQFSQPALPADLFEDFILPDLLSQHLHTLLVDSSRLDWHAFYVLPLVSRSWYYTCQRLFSGIFGTKRRPEAVVIQKVEDPEHSEGSDGFADPDEYDPSSILDYAMSVWKRAYHPSSRTTYSHPHNRSTLLADKSLVRVYTCLALGKTFLNEDVLIPLGALASNAQGDSPLDRTYRNAWNEDYEEENVTTLQTSVDESSMHRCLMLFECAQRLCDFVVPKRLALVAAGYMGKFLPLYHTLPLMTKYARDLRFNVERNYKLDLENYTEWTSRTLHSLETAEEFLEDLMNLGVMVRSFWDESGIPQRTLKLTGIISALDDVVRADWGDDTPSTRRRASALIRRWTVVE